jgi:hypothetical protein
MNNRLQTADFALVLGLLTLGFLTLRFVHSPGDFQEMIRRSDELQRLHQATLRREQIMQQTVQASIAHRCTLAETIQRWQEAEQELGQEWPVDSDILRQPHPLSDLERY